MNDKTVRLIGIDPGLTSTGYGVIDVGSERKIAVEGGVIYTKSDSPLEYRLNKIFTEIIDVVKTHGPEEMAIEDLHSNPSFVKTAILMAHARGVMVLVAGSMGIPVFNYAPTRVKNLITGSGRAPKQQVMQSVAIHLGEPDITKNEHVADAFAIALCHAMMSTVPFPTLVN